MIISTALSAHSRYWRQENMSWEQFVSLLSHYTITGETMQEYDVLTKDEKAGIKDVGGFVGGALLSGRRKKGYVKDRSLLCLDADFADDNFPQIVKDRLGDYTWAIYSTRSDRKGSRRFRLVMPLSAPCSADEYEPICRWVADIVGIDFFDGTTFQAERLMYWASVSSDQKFYFYKNDTLELDKDTVLSSYKDWTNPEEWAYCKSEEKQRPLCLLQKQADPTCKRGIVGAFCKAYPISQAIAEFLPDVYEPFNGSTTRFTYKKGTSSGGLVCYDDKFCYAHQNSDPAGGRLCNAWDLVRIHKFGQSTRSESQMCEFATSLNEVIKQLGMELKKNVEELYSKDNVENFEAQLTRDKKTGAVQPTVRNIQLIMENDDELKDSFRYDLFAERVRVTKPLVWRHGTTTGYDTWQDVDWAGMYNYLSAKYGFTGRSWKGTVDDVFNEQKMKRGYHPVKEYLELAEKCWDGTKRAERLFSDFLGAEDTRYNRQVCRKMLLGAVRRIYHQGCQFDAMCVLVGGQGGGKTSLLSRLGQAWFTNSIKDMGSKDALQQLAGKWIVEIGELSAMKRSDIDTVKNFITRRVDSFRPAFGREVKDKPRSCVLFGTCNDTNFLSDMSGNRRFWIVDVEQDRDKARHLGFKVAEALTPEFIQQIWGEVMSWGDDEPLYLPEDVVKQAEEQEAKYSSASEVIDIITNFLDTPVPAQWELWGLDQRVDWWKKHNDPNSGVVKGTILRDKISPIEVYQELIQATGIKDIVGGARGVKTVMRGLKDWVYTGESVFVSPAYGKQRIFMRRKK